MGKNLDIGTRIDGNLDQTNNQIIEKYYYNNDPALGEIYGGLYQWDELLDYSFRENVQGICPAGWEVPSHKDWMKLETELGMNQAEATLFEWRGTDQGLQLKEGGSSGFNAMMGGKRNINGQFENINFWSTFWNSTGYTRSIEFGPERFQIWNSRFDDFSNGFYVRCILNDSAYSTLGNEFAPTQNSPGIYTFEVTQTEDGCESASASVTLTIKESPIQSEGSDVSVCEGDPIPELEASGENVYWYNDPGLTKLVHNGNVFQTGHSLPGTYSFYPTQKLGDCESIPDTIVLTILPIPDPLTDTTFSVCEGELVPDLIIGGENVNWYNDETLLDLVNTGNHFATGKATAGIYTYYTTQTLSECVSPTSSITLVIDELPLPPIVPSIEICESEEIPALVATGDSIRWYDNTALEIMIHIGSSFESRLNSPGSYLFYATQTRGGCESLGEEVDLIINETPVISLGNDTVIHEDQVLILGPYPVKYNYLWSNTTRELFLIINGEEIGPGDHEISVKVSDDVCLYRDTIIITVESTIGIHQISAIEIIKVYPNPTDEFITVEIAEEVSENSILEIIDAKGAIVQKFRMKELLSGGDRKVKVRLDIPGIYYLQIYNGDQVYKCKVIRI